ncbi:trafficking protein particle complex subunit 12-like [Ptychodera flava]|uniref:trafficking protein particle complex subunit 12-like n=1 Tax=Ptychodera flava TaxID=63121 RepID=UPI00396A7826
MSDIDRRYNAWIPSESTRQILVAKVMSPNSVTLDRSQLTMPGVVVEDSQGDPIKELVYKFMGEQESNKRQMLTADNVSQNEEGLQQLIAGGCYRSAVDLTARLLDRYNQGNGAVGQQSLNTPLTLQIWFTRVALMMKLRLFSTVEVEIEAFGNLDKPDLFYEFYTEMYPGKRGSMVPFSFRMLHAELPQYNGRPQDTIDRLYYLHAITSKIISNLESGLAEDGSGIEISEENRKASVQLWKSRLIRILYSIGNCLAMMKDYNQASMVYRDLLDKDTANVTSILSSIGRIHLQLGDLRSAEKCFDEVEKHITSDKDKSQIYMNKAFYWLAQSNYAEAHSNFVEVLKIDPDNALAINNMSVCLLYVGKLKEALKTLENLVHKDPKYLQEGVLFNLCTVYELESSRSMHKKQVLLDLVNKHRGDGFNVQSLKMI